MDVPDTSPLDLPVDQRADQTAIDMAVAAASRDGAALQAALATSAGHASRSAAVWSCPRRRYPVVLGQSQPRQTVGVPRVTEEQAVAVMRAKGLTPLVPYPGRNDAPWPCRCDRCGEKVTPSYANARRQGGCRYCGNAASATARSVDPTAAAGVMRAAGFEPLEPYRTARTAWRCRCLLCGREDHPAYDNVRIKKEHGCQRCVAVALGQQRISAVEGEALAEIRAVGLEPLEPFSGVMNPWWCRCTRCDSEVAPTLNSIRTGLSSGCRFCGRSAGGARRRERGAAEAEALMREAGWEPLVPYPGRNRQWMSRCVTCEGKWTPILGAGQAGATGCPPCVYARISASKLAIGADRALADMRAVGLEPLQPYPGAREPWLCVCSTCGNESRPSLGSVRYLGTGCRFCAPSGFDLLAPARVYVLHHREYGAVKVGISGDSSKSDRVRQFQQLGWTVCEEFQFSVGQLAYEAEQSVLAHLRGRGLANFLGSDRMPIGGWTETFDATEVTPQEMRVLVLAQRAGAVC